MCGITGFCDYSRRSTESILGRMTDALHHRGPDDRGTEFVEVAGARVGLGHRRLSIIDLSPLGHQPMFDPSGDYAIVFNGEVYNFQEIRNELEEAGTRFRSTSDTEVVLHAFIRWGPEAVHRFIGMFAFAIHDRREDLLYLFRDRTGVKPLYYHWKNECFLFASELKSFHEHPAFSRELDRDSVATYLRYGWIPAPHCIFRDTYKLRPGHYLVVDIKRKSLREVEYWNVLDHYNRPKFSGSEEEAIEELEKLLSSASHYRMVADVPVGLFLSGGYDSATVAALLQKDMTSKLRTFTIGFDDPDFDEAPHAKRVAEHLGTDHVEHYCSRRDAVEIVPTLPEIFDEPFGDVSSIPTTLVSQIARRDVTVALSADAGDEIFAGYSKYTHNLALFERLASLPTAVRTRLGSVASLIERLPGIRGIDNMAGRMEIVKSLSSERDSRKLFRSKLEPRYFTDGELANLFLEPTQRLATNFDNFAALDDGNDGLNRMLAIDYQTYLVDDILVKVDRAAMSVSLEGREPLLDHRIIEFAATLPSNFKYRNGVQKYPLKQILHKYVPREMMDRPKRGFGAPVGDWLRNELSDLLMTSLGNERLAREGLFDPARVGSLRDDFLAGRNEASDKIWFLLSFQMWRERWL